MHISDLKVQIGTFWNGTAPQLLYLCFLRVYACTFWMNAKLWNYTFRPVIASGMDYSLTNLGFFLTVLLVLPTSHLSHQKICTNIRHRICGFPRIDFFFFFFFFQFHFYCHCTQDTTKLQSLCIRCTIHNRHKTKNLMCIIKSDLHFKKVKLRQKKKKKKWGN